MLDGIKSNGWHVKQGNNISSSGKLYVLFNQQQPYVDQFSQGRDMGWLSQTFAIPEAMSNFLGMLQQGLGKEGQGKNLDLSLAVLQAFSGALWGTGFCTPKAASRETGAQAREPLDVTARQQKWTPELQQAGDTWPRHSWWHSWWQGHRVAMASLVGGMGKPALKKLLFFGTLPGIPLSRAEKVQLLQGGSRWRSAARNCRLCYFV